MPEHYHELERQLDRMKNLVEDGSNLGVMASFSLVYEADPVTKIMQWSASYERVSRRNGGIIWKDVVSHKTMVGAIDGLLACIAKECVL